jgi:diaminopimelate decarboxylase
MSLVLTLIRRYFSVSNGALYVGGIPVGTIAAKYGTPLFIYDSDVLHRKWTILRNTYPAEFGISYSVKANPNRTVLKYFLAKGCGLEVASGGEFYQAIRAGCPAEKIVYAGPGKTEAELELVLTQGIGELHIESLGELERVRTISRRLGLQARVAVRVNPSPEAEGGAMRMGGKGAPFGIDEENLDAVLDQLLGDPALEFRGVHLFTGTQILDHLALISQYFHGFEIAKQVASRVQRPLHTIDFGGGLGIPYFPNEQELDMAELRQGLTTLMDKAQGEALFSGTQFMVEPGRYLVGEAGIYVTRIIDIKVSRGKKFLIVDGGMNHHLAASGNLGQIIKRNFPLALLNQVDSSPEETVDIVGPLCTPLDVLARATNLPAAEIGDLVGIFQSGGYARTASPLSFLSHPAPPEVWVEAGRDYLIRRRGTYGGYLQDQCFGDSSGL